MNENNKQDIRKLLRLDFLEKRIMRTFSTWDAAQTQKVGLLIDLLLLAIDRFHIERMRKIQKAQHAK